MQIQRPNLFKPSYLGSKIIKLLLAIILAILTITPAAASQCFVASLDNRFQNSDAVFAAEIGEYFEGNAGHEPDQRNKKPLIWYYYETKYIWKGSPGRSGYINLCHSDYSVCGSSIEGTGLDPQGKVYLIFATSGLNGLLTSRCKGTQLLDVAFSDRMELGEPLESYELSLAEITPEFLRDKLSSEKPGDARRAASLLTTRTLGRSDVLITHMLQHEWPCDVDTQQIEDIKFFFQVLKTEATPLINEFEYIWACSNPEFRASWVSVLGDITVGAELLENVKRGLRDDSYQVRRQASFIAPKIKGSFRKEIRKHLFEMMQSDSPSARLSGAEGITAFISTSSAFIITFEEAKAVCTLNTDGMTEFEVGRSNGACRSVDKVMRSRGKENQSGQARFKMF